MVIVTSFPSDVTSCVYEEVGKVWGSPAVPNIEYCIPVRFRQSILVFPNDSTSVSLASHTTRISWFNMNSSPIRGIRRKKSLLSEIKVLVVGAPGVGKSGIFILILSLYQRSSGMCSIKNNELAESVGIHNLRLTIVSTQLMISSNGNMSLPFAGLLCH